jgi:hypothetical protein
VSAGLLADTPAYFGTLTDYQNGDPSPLVEAGVLTEFTGFKRNRMWQSREVLSALDDFAARAVRGTRD